MTDRTLRMNRALARCLVLTALGAACAGCGGPRQADPKADPVVTVSILPQKYFVERIAGDLVRVNVMVGPGESPATYEPKPSQLTALRYSIAYLTLGVPYERVWLPRLKSAHPDLRTVDTIANIQRLPMPSGHAHHGQATAYMPDPHVWLSPALVKKQSVVVCASLSELLPEHTEVFEENLKAFEADLDTLDSDLRSLLDEFSGRAFMVFHPSWGYFAHDYGLEMIPMEIGGQEPSPAERQQLISHGRDEGVRTVLVQPESNAHSAGLMARTLNARLITVSPLAPDWLANMRQVAEALAEGFRSDAP